MLHFRKSLNAATSKPNNRFLHFRKARSLPLDGANVPRGRNGQMMELSGLHRAPKCLYV